MGMAGLLSKDQALCNVRIPPGEKLYKCNECVKLLSNVHTFGDMRRFTSERKHTV